MARDVRQIRIESILGGQGPLTYFASGSDEFRASLGIDPSRSFEEFQSTFAPAPGLIRPVASSVFGTTVSAPLWIKATPRTTDLFVYDSAGSVYAYTGGAVNGLGDLNDGGDASGNGSAYYDNYVYFARDTTIARYGPLDGTPTFTDDYWSGTLGLSPLTNTAEYPRDRFVGTRYPNHVMHRHSDGRLYIADVVDNKGVIHFISTTKTTVEGDTNNGSTFSALEFGYGLWPTALESYGDMLVVALYENQEDAIIRNSTAKLAFWDTVSEKSNLIIFSEFPDQMITGLKNVNGTLYIVSGNSRGSGFRVSRYVGGHTIDEVGYFEQGQSPMPGAIDGTADRLLFGSWTVFPSLSKNTGAIYSLGLQKKALGNGLFTPIRAIQPDGGGYSVYSLVINNSDLVRNYPVFGVFRGSSPPTSYAGYVQVSTGTDFTDCPAIWQSQVYRIGQPFKITKIRIPVLGTGEGLISGNSVDVSVFTDDSETEKVLTTINTTNYSVGDKIVVQRPTNLVGNWSFFLQLTWSGTSLCTIGLPITIEYELIDD